MYIWQDLPDTSLFSFNLKLKSVILQVTKKQRTFLNWVIKHDYDANLTTYIDGCCRSSSIMITTIKQNLKSGSYPDTNGMYYNALGKKYSRKYKNYLMGIRMEAALNAI